MIGLQWLLVVCQLLKLQSDVSLKQNVDVWAKAHYRRVLVVSIFTLKETIDTECLRH